MGSNTSILGITLLAVILLGSSGFVFQDAFAEAPILSSIGTQLVAENSILNFTVTATDADLDLLTITSNATSLSFGAFEDNGDGTATLEFNPGFSDTGIYKIVVDVTDGTASDTETFSLDVTNTNQAPILANIGFQLVAENSILNFTVTATDADLDSLTITSNATSLSFGAFNDNGDGTASLQFTPGFDGTGVYSINVDVTDGTASDDETFLLNVTNTNQAPILANIGAQLVAENSILNFTVTATATNEFSKIHSTISPKVTLRFSVVPCDTALIRQSAVSKVQPDCAVSETE